MKIDFQQIIPFFLVGIVAVVIGTNAVSNRPQPAEIGRIHNVMIAERDAFLPQFVEMGFELKVEEVEEIIRRYPMPDQRYQCKVSYLSPIIKSESTPAKTKFYDFSDASTGTYVVDHKARDIETGDKIVKASGDSTYQVIHPDGSQENFEFNWRVFIQEEIYN